METAEHILPDCLVREIRVIALRDLAGPRRDRFLRAHEFERWIYFNTESRAEEEAAMELYRKIAEV